MIGLPIVLLIAVAIARATALIMFFNPVVAESALPQPILMPELPQELTSLPKLARTWRDGSTCMDTAEVSATVDLWTYPAIFPSRPDDSVYDWTPSGILGARQGQLPLCSLIQVTEYAWSEIDGEFYVRIQVASMASAEHEGESGQRGSSNQPSGWIPFRLLVFQ